MGHLLESYLSGVHGVVALRPRVLVRLEQHHVDEGDQDGRRAEAAGLHCTHDNRLIMDVYCKDIILFLF